MTARRTEEGRMGPAGEVGFRVVRNGVAIPVARPERWLDGALTVDKLIELGTPQRGLDDGVNAWRKANRRRVNEAYRTIKLRDSLARKGIVLAASSLYLRIIKADGRVIPLGFASSRLVTTAGVGFIVDAFQNIVELEIMKYHGIGTGGGAEATGDTALTTELTTQYNPDNTRATGSTTENGANVYRTVGTNTVDASVGITEHGIFSQAATGGGVLLDRSLFSVVNLVSADSLESTYDLTVAAGG